MDPSLRGKMSVIPRKMLSAQGAIVNSLRVVNLLRVVFFGSLGTMFRAYLRDKAFYLRFLDFAGALLTLRKSAKKAEKGRKRPISADFQEGRPDTRQAPIRYTPICGSRNCNCEFKLARMFRNNYPKDPTVYKKYYGIVNY